MSVLPVHPWRAALVTGASAGIGEAFARSLSRRGCDVVLVARRADRLESLAVELRGLGVAVEVLPADLSTASGLGVVENRLRDRDRPVDLLVNNAGFGSAGRFWELPLDGELLEISTNVTALVHLTHTALGVFVPEGRGSVCNISSIAGNQAGPGQAVYGATKAFVTSFTEAVAVELRGSGVTATAVLPGLTHTEFHTVAGKTEQTDALPGFAWMSPAAVADAALRDTLAGKVISVPGAFNAVVSGVSTVTPRRLQRAVASANIKRFLSG
jgi:short-subunit dehydrogenase